MTTSQDVRTATGALRRAAVRATFAPSVHNTQPWRMLLGNDELGLLTDRTRQLQVLDPTGRQLVISCGCALFNARVSLAASDLTAVVTRFPDMSRSDLLATIAVGEHLEQRVDPIAALDNVVELRRTNRRRFAQDAVPPEVLEVLERAALAEDSILVQIHDPAQRLAVARLSQQADALQNSDAGYRAELRAWTTTDLARLDGVPATAVPHVTGESHDEVPIRDFDTSGQGLLPSDTNSPSNQCLLLLGTRGDNPASWLRAGEALQRILLEITRHGYTASPLTQVIEAATTREALQTELGLTMMPHILLRVGRAAVTPATRRRRLVDVLVERP
jgi:hypothetical protein